MSFEFKLLSIMFGMPILAGLVLYLLIRKNREKTNKYFFLIGIIGSYIAVVLIFALFGLPLAFALVLGIGGSIFGILWGLGYRLMANDAATKFGRMRESDRKKEKDEMLGSLGELFGKKEKNKAVDDEEKKGESVKPR